LKISVIACCALVTAAVPAPASAQERLGRMFFTPAQRTSLDIARNQRARATLSTDRSEEEAAPAAQTITYGGMVRRDDGKSTIWLNNQPVNDRDAVGGAAIVGRVRADGGVTLQVPQSGRRVDLKPGQSVELLSGAIEEAYSRRPLPEPEPKPKPGAKPPAGKGGKPASPEQRAREERDREDREQLQDDAARALRDAMTAKPAAATAAPSDSPR
jgi:hypothetical protein